MELATLPGHCGEDGTARAGALFQSGGIELDVAAKPWIEVPRESEHIIIPDRMLFIAIIVMSWRT